MTFWWSLMCLTWQDNDQVLWKTLLAESTERNDCADGVWDATPAPVTGLQSAIPEVTQGTRLYWWHLQLRSTHLVLSNHCCSGFPHEKMDIIGKEHKKKNAEVTNTWLLKNLQEQKAGAQNALATPALLDAWKINVECITWRAGYKDNHSKN